MLFYIVNLRIYKHLKQFYPMKKIFVLILSISFLPYPLLANSDNSSSIIPQSLYLDYPFPLLDKEKDFLSRSEYNELNGNYTKSIDNIKDLITTFIANDKQLSIVFASFLLAEQYIHTNNIKSAVLVLKDIDYRLSHYIVTQDSTMILYQNRLSSLQYLITVLANLDNSAMLQTLIVPIKTLLDKIQKQNLDNRNTTMILNLTLGYIYHQSKNYQVSLDYLYQSLSISNQVFSFSFFYLISRKIIDIYLEQKELKKAFNRVISLNNLFSTSKPSNYFKAKILFLLAEIFHLQGQFEKEIGTLERTYELVSTNNLIDEQTKSIFIHQLKNKIQFLEKRHPELREKGSPFILLTLLNQDRD